MSLIDRLYCRPATLVRRSTVGLPEHGVDSHGVWNYTNGQETQEVLCWYSQRKDDEDRSGGQLETLTGIVYLHPSTDVEGIDAFIFEGYKYEVAGPPEKMWSPRCGGHHWEITVRRTSGG